jgi:hypothetical protein
MMTLGKDVKQNCEGDGCADNQHILNWYDDKPRVGPAFDIPDCMALERCIDKES